MRAGTVLTFERGLVRPHLRGMVLVKPPLLGRAACVPADALVGVPLFLDEAELAKQSSPYRVLTRLGMEIPEFPFPPSQEDEALAQARYVAESDRLLSVYILHVFNNGQIKQFEKAINQSGNMVHMRGGQAMQPGGKRRRPKMR